MNLSCIKTTLNSQIRRFKVDRNTSLDKFLKYLSSLYKQDIGMDNYVLKYIDDEGDLVTCEAEEEWEDALKLSEGGVLKVQVLPRSCLKKGGGLNQFCDEVAGLASSVAQEGEKYVSVDKLKQSLSVIKSQFSNTKRTEGLVNELVCKIQELVGSVVNSIESNLVTVPSVAQDNAKIPEKSTQEEGSLSSSLEIQQSQVIASDGIKDQNHMNNDEQNEFTLDIDLSKSTADVYPSNQKESKAKQPFFEADDSSPGAFIYESTTQSGAVPLQVPVTKLPVQTPNNFPHPYNYSLPNTFAHQNQHQQYQQYQQYQQQQQQQQYHYNHPNVSEPQTQKPNQYPLPKPTLPSYLPYGNNNLAPFNNQVYRPHQQPPVAHYPHNTQHQSSQLKKP